MEYILQRIQKTPGYTLGHLFADGNYICDTLEPTWRGITRLKGRKKEGRTAIPEGNYPVVIAKNNEGEWLPLLLAVPWFKDVRICMGSGELDTQQNILVGTHKRDGKLVDTRRALALVKKAFVEARNRDEAVRITIVDQCDLAM